MEIPQDSTPEPGLDEPVWRAGFLAALRDTGNVRAACEAVGIDRGTPYKSRDDDAEFRRRWDDTLQDASDLLVLEARRRAYSGVQEPVIHLGKLQGTWVDADGNTVGDNTPGATLIPLTVAKYSDQLLMFLIRQARPEFRDNPKVTVAGDPAAPLKHDHTVTTLTGRLDQLAAAFAGAADREETGGPSSDGI